MTKTEEVKNRVSAADVILAAAKQSGLLNEVAEAMCFIDKHPDDVSSACALYEGLAEVFDDHVVWLPSNMIEGFYGDGICIGPFTEAELAPYLTQAPSKED